MEPLQLILILSALLCSLVAGLVLAFAIVVMPGIRTLGTLGYLQSFKAMDLVIQNNQPIFMLVWVGSALAILASTVLGFGQLEGFDRALLIVTCVFYILGVHVPTATINIPLNNRLQAEDLDSMPQAEMQAMAEEFETTWLRWNTIRTVVATLTTVSLLFLLVRL